MRKQTVTMKMMTGLGVNIYEKGMIVDVKKVSSHPVKTKKKDQRIMFMPVFN